MPPTRRCQEQEAKAYCEGLFTGIVMMAIFSLMFNIAFR